GVLTAPTQPGDYQIMAGGGMGYGVANLTVLDSVTSLKPNKSTVTLQPGDTEDLSCQAFYQDSKVASSDTSFTWQLEGNIGTINNEGVLTLSPDAQGKGRIVVRYGSLSTYVDVIVSDGTGSIEDFENGSVWGISTVRAKSGSASVVEDASLARSGTKLLKVDYDFTLDAGVEKGVAGVYVFRKDSNGNTASIVLPQNPTGIGMYVYGNNGKDWVRARLKDGKGQSFDIDFTPDYRTDTLTGGVDWTGWKYVEAKIPVGKQGPFTLEIPIRIMCSRDDMRSKGTLYFDRIRCVYGDSTVDTEAPAASILTPAALSVQKSGKVPFSAEISDNGSGVDTKSIQVLIDGLPATGLQVISNGNVTLKGDLGAATPLADGLHNLVLNYADLNGNQGSLTTSFTVDTGSTQIIASSSPTFYSGGNFTTTVSAKNPKNLKKVYVTLYYNPSQLELIDADTKAKGKQIALEGWVKKGKVLTHAIDEKAGKIVLEIDNLTNLSSSALSKIGTVTFKAKTTLQGATRITTGLSAVILGKNKDSQRFILPSMNVNFDYGMTLKAYGFSEGDITSFTVTDRNGAPVEGATLVVDGKESALKTDKAGKAQTTLLTSLPVGSSVKVQANKAGVISNIASLIISDKNAGLVPQDLNLTLTASGGAIAMNYITPKEQAGTLVQYAEKSTFTGSFSTEGIQAALGTDQETSLVNGQKTSAVRVHSVILENLKPGTAYIYRIGDATGRFSSAYEMTTPAYDKPYSFVFVTDPQSADNASYQVFGDVLKRGIEKAVNPAFVLMGGDLTDNGGNKGQWGMLFNVGSNVFSCFPMAAAPGNHEYAGDAKLTNFTSYFTFPENGPSGLKEDAYSFQTSDALFMVLDTQKPLQPQLQWVEQNSKASDKKWKIVMMHRGIYSGFYDEAEFRKLAAPSFDRAGIDLVLNGHDHTYLRTTMKGGKKVAPGAGTTYVTGGSAAKKYYDAKKRTWTEVLYDANNPVFTTFRVYSDHISVVSYHIEKGVTVEHDRFDITKK
ncbi:MAG: metallophosphoesterase, partial [Clostridia bacterium]|nr:metallophosphoesterase [Clostridia bacterium]